MDVSRETLNTICNDTLMALSVKDIVMSSISQDTLNNAEKIFLNNSDEYSLLIDRWLWWNRSVNLFSRSTSAAQLKNHIIHSLFLLFESRSKNHDVVLDAGTGGGLPGLPMAIADPQMNYCLVDKVSKKHFALKNIIRSLSIQNIQPVCSDINDIHFEHKIRVVSKHAFHIPELLKISHNFNWTEFSLLKGDDLFHELDGQLIRNYDIQIRKIECESTFFHNKYIVSILNKTSDNQVNEQ